jgi:hypothetical protein
MFGPNAVLLGKNSILLPLTYQSFVWNKSNGLAGRKIGTRNGPDFRQTNKWEGREFFQHKACRSQAVEVSVFWQVKFI